MFVKLRSAMPVIRRGGYRSTQQFFRKPTYPSRQWPLGLTPTRYSSGYGGPPMPNQIGPQNTEIEEDTTQEKTDRASDWSPTLFKMFESAATTIVSLVVLGYVM